MICCICSQRQAMISCICVHACAYVLSLTTLLLLLLLFLPSFSCPQNLATPMTMNPSRPVTGLVNNVVNNPSSTTLIMSVRKENILLKTAAPSSCVFLIFFAAKVSGSHLTCYQTVLVYHIILVGLGRFFFIIAWVLTILYQCRASQK